MMRANMWCLCLGLSCCLALTTAAEPVRLGYADRSFFPLQLGEGALPVEPPGRAVTSVLKSAASLELRTELQRLPIKRLLLMLERGELDGAFSFSYLPERVRSMVFPMTSSGPDSKRSLGVLEYYLYTRSDFVPHGLDGSVSALAAYRIGVLKDTAIASLLKAQAVPYEATKTIEQNLQKLLLGRIDIFIGQKESTQQQLSKRTEFKTLRRSGEPLFSRHYYLVFSHPFYRQHRQWCEAWWRVLAQQSQE